MGGGGGGGGGGAGGRGGGGGGGGGGGVEMSTVREQGMMGYQNREKRKSLFFPPLLSLPPTLLSSMIKEDVSK